MSIVLNKLLKVIFTKIYNPRLLATNKGISMSVEADMKKLENEFISLQKKIAPSLAISHYKGQAGKIGIMGGSVEYTGAPYFAGMSALKLGADLVHIFCHKDASIPLKCYSPELIVHPIDPIKFENTLDVIKTMDVLVIGPGLGRDLAVMSLVKTVLDAWNNSGKPLVLDADALFLISQEPNLIKKYCSPVYLTPNKIELIRILKQTPGQEIVCNIGEFMANNGWNSVTILAKAEEDVFYSTTQKFECNLGGSGRRCGGQGDILAGSLAVFIKWLMQKDVGNKNLLACYAACKLTRQCNSKAFQKHGRSMTASDMMQEIHQVFEEQFEE